MEAGREEGTRRRKQTHMGHGCHCALVQQHAHGNVHILPLLLCMLTRAAVLLPPCCCCVCPGDHLYCMDYK